MPNAPLKPCAERRCPELVPKGTARCTAHTREQYQRRDAARGPKQLERRKLYHSTRWRKARKSYLLRHPLCVGCRRAAAREVDHIKPIAQGGAMWDEANWQGLCKPCHSRKTAREVLSGAG